MLATGFKATSARPFATVAVLCGLVAGGVVATAAPASAYNICNQDVNVFRWDGSANDPPSRTGNDRTWNDPYNWDQDCTPGLLNQPHDDDVTIPRGANVFLLDGHSAHVAALHNRGALTLTPGARLVTLGDSSSHTLTLQGGLAGRGRFTVTSLLRWTSTAAGAATQSTRRCDLMDCSSPVAGKLGRTVIASGATMTIAGRGVNLADQRIIENHGTVKLARRGYIAADDGTAFRNLRTKRSTGRFLIANNRGYYRGFSSKDLGYTTNLGLSKFVNTGRIIKTAGDGTSIIDADYARRDPSSSYTGQVEVRSGTLSIFNNGGANRARVSPGAGFANGGTKSCDSGSAAGCSTIQTTAQDPRAIGVELTSRRSPAAVVTIEELSRGTGKVTTSTTAARLGRVGGSLPQLVRIYLDKTKVQQLGDSPRQVARTAPVRWKEANWSRYRKLANCSDHQPPCVARGLSVQETKEAGNGDAVLVVSAIVDQLVDESRHRVG